VKKVDWKQQGNTLKGTVERRKLKVVAYLILRDGTDYVARTNPFGYEIVRTPSLEVCKAECARLEG